MGAVVPKQWWVKPRLIAPVNRGVRSDGMGDGSFGAPRDGGLRRHRGVDLLAPEGERVWAPCGGLVGQEGQCYRHTEEYRYVRIESPWAEVRLLYVKPCVQPGDAVEAGQLIGHAQDIAKEHGPLMENHIHLEVRVVGGVLIGIEGHTPEDVVTVNPRWFMEI